MLAIKLQRIGRKHQPSYRLVVAERRTKMAAPPVEDLGSYHPKSKQTSLKKERITYWLSVGAQPTVTAHNLLVSQSVISAPKKAVKMAKIVVAPVVAETPVATPAEVAVAEPVTQEPAPEAAASEEAAA